VIDVLAMYTPNARNAVGGDQAAWATIASAETLTNATFANSGVNARIRIIGILAATGYTGPDDNSGIANFQAGTDGANAPALRDYYGADVAVLFVSGGTGVGYMPVPPTVNTDNAAYAQVNINYIGYDYYAHELGHNLGANHDRYVSPETVNPAYAYNHGYVAPSGSWRTVMAYPDACNGCPMIPYYSNPNLVYQGEAMGVPDGQPAAADNARVLNQTASTVAGYRVSLLPSVLYNAFVTVDPAQGGNAGTYVNGPYTPGSVVTAVAWPAAGYHFLDWTLNGQFYSTNSQVSIQINSDVQLTAHFAAGGQGAPPVNRIYGADRYATGIALSQRVWSYQHAQAVVLARGDSFPDALAGVPLAARKGGPLLLTDGTALNPEVAGELRRILPRGRVVFILGGTSAISSGVESQVQRYGYPTVRLAGADRFGTALAIAKDWRALNNPARVVVATGDNFPDALAAGPYAALSTVSAAIVLSNGRSFDRPTGDYVRSKVHNQYGVVGVGGPAAAALSSLLGGGFGVFSGPDRYATAAEIAGLGWPSAFPAGAPVGLTTGLGYADAMTGGSFMAASNGPIMLTDPGALPDSTGAQLAALRNTMREVDIIGGPNAVGNGVFGQTSAKVNGR
jgi:hypothetical protein